MADFTGQNIQDTYQRVVQIDNGQLQDGTGSALVLLNVTASHAISASHEITFELSSSHAETADFLTPGNDINVRHITASGAISSSFVGAHQFGPVKIQNGDVTLDTDGTSYPLSSADGILSIGHPSATSGTKFNNPITASGDISASGTITGIINGGTF